MKKNVKNLTFLSLLALAGCAGGKTVVTDASASCGYDNNELSYKQDSLERAEIKRLVDIEFAKQDSILKRSRGQAR